MKKSIFLFFAAILCAIGMNAADTYYFRGGHNSWGSSNKMTTSTDGHYVYYHINDISMNQGKEFKINKNDADSWDQSHYDIVNNYNGTDLNITASDNRSISAAGYVILYLPNTLVNPSNKAILCASTKLTDGIEQVFLKHPWNGGGWEYCNALTKNSSGKLVITKKYGSAGCNWSMKKEAWYEKWVATPTLVNEPQTGDDCEFAFDPADQTITITKQLTKNIGSITITMACDQHPNIYYYGGVDGSVTYPEWPGVNMTDNGDGTYSYKVDNVNLDLGLDYIITLKEVNENEWKSADLNAKANVSHDVSIFNFPKIVVLGIDGKWDDTNALTEVSNDYLTVSKTISFAEAGSHNLKCHVGSAQYQGGSVVDITRANPSSNKFDKDYGGDGKFTADINGDYVFTWTYKTGTLSVTYPELPTPEYKDITIQVYAKEVPNIWWWNGGDNCPSTEDIVNPSTGNNYKWEEAPAMEKVAGEDNWYTKTFAQVDITKGGIKFKLQSTDHNTSTTNEVVTTEDKCYDARVFTVVTETTCGELPAGEVPTVTYNVTVPTGTPACYIAGAMNGWSHQAMTRVDETHYTITIEGAQKTQEYKYSASNNWDLVELNEDGSEKSNRTWTENDVVAKWATPPTYTIVGATDITGANWDPANAENLMAKDGEAYTLTKTGLKLVAGDYEYKVAKNGAWGDGEYPNGTNEKVTIAENGIYTIVYTYTVGTSLTAVATKTGEYTPDPVEVKYYLVGTMNSWTNGDATYELSLEGDGLYHYNVTLNAGTHEFKVYDATGVNTYGYSQLTKKNYNELSEGEYSNIKLTLAASAEVTITFNGETKAITLTSTALTENTTALTYTVTVPAGTAKCYICGAWDWNTFMEMTPTANANEFTIDIVGATTGQEYKYTRGEGWEYAEVNEDGSTRANRTYNANDVVAKWADVITYVLMGVNGDWTTGIPMIKDGEQYVCKDVTIDGGDDAVKAVTLTNGAATAWCGNVDSYSDATSTADADGNIVLEDGIYDFYFKLNDVNDANDDQIYIDQTAYVRNVTNTYGTICLPYASASTSGATFFEVVGKEAGKVYLASVTSLTAGVPYIFEKNQSATQIKVVYKGEKASTASSSNGLIGNFTNEKVVPAGSYILYSGAFIPADGTTNKVNAYRAYLDLSAVEGGAPTRPMPGRRYIGMDVQGENVETGLDNNQLPISNIQKLIENGQLIIIRDGVKYNVQGQVIR